jgi:uncharacterized protein YhdP
MVILLTFTLAGIQKKEPQLNAYANFDEIDLLYDSAWPALFNLKGLLTLDEEGIIIKSDQGKIFDSKIDSVTAKILFVEPYQAQVNGIVQSSLIDTFSFLKTSPLETDVVSGLSINSIIGKVTTTLDLKIPIETNDPAVVSGTATLHNAAMSIVDADKIQLTNLNGDINFKQDAIESNNLTFRFNNEPAVGSISSMEAKQEVVVTINSKIDSIAISKFITDLDTTKIQGKSKFDAKIHINHEEVKDKLWLEFNTDLKGIALGLPEPIGKSENTAKPLNLRMRLDSTGHEINVSATDVMQAKLISVDGLWSGNIDFGEKAHAEIKDKKSLHLTGTLNYMDLFDYAKLTVSEKSLFYPIVASINVNELKVAGFHFNEVNLSYVEKQKLLTLTAADVKGKINFMGQNNFNFDFEKITLDSSLTDFDLSNLKFNDSKLMPGIAFNCDELIYKSKLLGKLEASIIYHNNGYDINSVLEKKNSLIQLQGRWQNPGKTFQTSEINGNWTTDDFGSLISWLGLSKDFSRGSGQIALLLKWPGSLFKVNKKHLEGRILFDLKNGQITSVAPGIGKVLGLLSVSQIAKRMQLDFSDVLSKGLSYDHLLSKVEFHHGKAAIQSLNIDSPSAVININGDVDLESQKLKLIMEVSAKVGDTLSVAAALAAGNPAIGVGVWIMDKIIGNKLSAASMHRYWVGGTLNTPIINKAEELKINKPEEIKINKLNKLNKPSKPSKSSKSSKANKPNKPSKPNKPK